MFRGKMKTTYDKTFQHGNLIPPDALKQAITVLSEGNDPLRQILVDLIVPMVPRNIFTSPKTHVSPFFRIALSVAPKQRSLFPGGWHV
jgi:hypothetical protein